MTATPEPDPATSATAIDASQDTTKRKKPKRPRKAALVLATAGLLPLPWWLAYPGALLSGLLYWLAFAGWNVWPLAFVALVPLLVSMHRQTPRRSLALGLIAGLTMNVAGFYWLQDMLMVFSGFPAPLCMVFVFIVCCYQGGRLALFGWLYARASARGWSSPLVFVAAFVASELLYPLLFPWYYAATVHQIPVLTQTAELGGPYLVGIVLVAANLVLAEPLLARAERRKMRVPVLAGGALTVAIALAFGAWRIGAVDAMTEAAEPVKVGLVQANMSLTGKRSDPDEGLRRHLQMTRELKEQGVDFVVWSETSAMRASEEDKYAAEVEHYIGRRLGIPTIFGAVLIRPDAVRDIYFNTAVSTDTSGKVNGRYDKTFLLMFGEYLPFGETFPDFYKWSPHSGRFSEGSKVDPLTVQLGDRAHPVSMLICYEDIIPSFTNKAVAHAKPELLVNMTNDAWFGDTTEPWEHLALATFRSIEHRRFLVRSTNSGVSAIIDPVGRVVQHTSPFKKETLVATVRWMQSSTVYETVRDWPWYALSLAVILGAFFKNRRRAPELS